MTTDAEPVLPDTDPAQPMAEPATPFSIFDELSSFLLWLSKRWPGLGLGGLVLAMLLWIDFISLFDLPVSFISPGILSALPILGLSVGVPVVGAIVIAALMAFVLWQPLHKGGPSLVTPVSTPDDGVKRPDVFMRWLVLCLVHAFYWVAYLGVVSLHFKPSGEWVWLLAFVLPGIYGFFSFWPVFRAASPKYPSGWFIILFAGCLASLTAFSGLLFLPLVSAAGATGSLGTIVHLEAYVAIMVGVALVQLVTAKLVMRGWRRGLLRKVFLFVMALLVPVLAFPGVGGQFASYRLRLSGPAHAPCMVLVFRQGQTVTDSIPQAVVGAGAGHSVPFEFVTRLDDQYYVKAHVFEGPTFVVPVSAIGGFEACPKGASMTP